MSNWQKMDSAPKDGTVILAFFDRECVATIQWSPWGGGVWQNTLTGHNILCFVPKRWLALQDVPVPQEESRSE